jgi:tetratricopeptide (TPR) repeat protein
MEEEIQKAGADARKAWPFVMSWVGGATAILGLTATIAGGITWFVDHHKQKIERDTKMALAEAQAKQGEYQASFQSYGEILKADPLYRPAIDQQLNTVMLWVEDFHDPDPENQSSVATALDQIMATLDSGLTRAKGSQAADVQAHIGWAHWLNQRIAEREFDPAVEQNFRAALATDPSNVYANAMLGNWMLRNRKSFSEAIQHIDTAVSTGKARAFVRTLQLGGLLYLDKKGARAEVVKAANDMRKSQESLDEGTRKSILGFCFVSVVADHAELAESLSAVPPDDAWATYLWLDDNSDNDPGQLMVHDFIKANLLEISGNRQESLDRFRLLQKKLKNQPGTMKNSVDAAIARLSHS